MRCILEVKLSIGSEIDWGREFGQSRQFEMVDIEGGLISCGHFKTRIAKVVGSTLYNLITGNTPLLPFLPFLQKKKKNGLMPFEVCVGMEGKRRG